MLQIYSINEQLERGKDFYIIKKIKIEVIYFSHFLFFCTKFFLKFYFTFYSNSRGREEKPKKKGTKPHPRSPIIVASHRPTNDIPEERELEINEKMNQRFFVNK